MFNKNHFFILPQHQSLGRLGTVRDFDDELSRIGFASEYCMEAPQLSFGKLRMVRAFD